MRSAAALVVGVLLTISGSSAFAAPAGAAAVAAVAFVSGGPHRSAAGLQSIRWMPGRIVCGKTGSTLITWAKQMGQGVAMKFPALEIAAEPAAPVGAPKGSYYDLLYWGISSSGHWSNALCRRVASVGGTAGVHQTATAKNRTRLLCHLGQGVQVQGRWLDKGFHAAQLDIASGRSRAAVAVATMSLTGTKLTYDPRVCHKVGFTYVPPAPAPTSTTPSTNSTTTTTTTTP